MNREAAQGLEPLLRAARGRGNFIFCPEFYFLSPSLCLLPARAPLLLHVAGTRCAEQLHCLQLQGCGRAGAVLVPVPVLVLVPVPRQQRMVVLGAGLGRGAAAGWDVCECSMRSAGRNSMSSFAALPHVWPLAPSSFWALHGPISCNSDTVLSVSSSPLSQKHPAPWQRVWPHKPKRGGVYREIWSWIFTH